MATNPEQLEARVAFLEREMRRTNAVIDDLEMRTDKHLSTIDKHLDAQDANLHEFAEETNKRFEAIDARFEAVDKRFEAIDKRFDRLEQSVDKRFDHVYGQLADLTANTVEIRNILAALVEKQK